MVICYNSHKKLILYRHYLFNKNYFQSYKWPFDSSFHFHITWKLQKVVTVILASTFSVWVNMATWPVFPVYLFSLNSPHMECVHFQQGVTIWLVLLKEIQNRKEVPVYDSLCSFSLLQWPRALAGLTKTEYHRLGGLNKYLLFTVLEAVSPRSGH